MAEENAEESTPSTTPSTEGTAARFTTLSAGFGHAASLIRQKSISKGNKLLKLLSVSANGHTAVIMPKPSGKAESLP